MINLIVENYCHNCPGFEPDVKKYEYESGSGDEINTTDIYCKHKVRCTFMVMYLEDRINRKKGERL